jgi:ABC-type multidrug transport system fused ATPase/permease subunit
MKKLFSYCLDKWWILPLSSSILIGLSFLFSIAWPMILSLLLIMVMVISQFIRKGWKSGCLASVILFVFLFISGYWFISQVLSPSPDRIHRHYAKRYEKRTEIQKITGLEISEFKVVNSRLTNSRNFDFEFNVQATIEFRTVPDHHFYSILDSICMLPVPEVLDENSSFFYYGVDKIHRCWSKEGDQYIYNRINDSGEKFLHSSDAYFRFLITRGSATAELEYGNY